MRNIKTAVFFCFLSATLAAQPVNDDPCGARVLIPVQATCLPFEDNNINSQTSLINATVTMGFGVYDFNCNGEPTNNLNDIWFKIPLSQANLVIKSIPVPGMDVEMQVYYRQSGQCADNDLMMEILACGAVAGTGLPDSVLIPSNYNSLYDTVYIRVYNFPDGTGPSPVNNSQFSICAYYPAPACSINTFPADAAMLFESVSLNWAYSQNASSYDVYLGSSVATAVFIGNTISTDFDITGLNLLPGNYYWYVNPKNGIVAATGCSSSATLFTILETAPNDKRCNAILLTASDLACNPYSDPSINSSTSYNRATYTNDVVGAGANCTLNSFLSADVWFKFSSPDSAYYVFRVEPVAGINTSFRIFESTNSCSGGFINKGCFNNGAIAIADTALILLNPGKEYFIQVFSQNGTRDFEPPANSQFGICIYKPAPPCIDPLLVSPSNGAVNIDHITGSLSWKDVAGTTNYDLYVGTSIATMQLVSYSVLQNSGGNKVLNFHTNFSNGSPFSPGVQYFWKVIPMNGDVMNTGCAQEIRTFITATCPGSLLLLNPVVTGTHAGEIDFNVNCPNCDASWMVFEYGPNPNPGTGTTASTGNTIIYPVPLTPAGYAAFLGVDSISQLSNIRYHFRLIGCPAASGSFLPLNPGSAATLGNCTTTTITLFDGKGRWNFNGSYPVNSNGRATPGKMTWFNFTPAESGVYYLQVDSVEVTDPINYLYKTDSLNRYSPGNWTGIGSINKKGKYAIGYLTAGLLYHFTADSENDSLLNKISSVPGPKRHFVKICKAGVAAPSVINNCLDATIYNPVPALSTKEEFAIDTSGQLIASIKPGADSLGMVTVSYYVNGNGLRFDANGREFMDRNFTITPSLPVSSVQQVKLFFNDQELADLIDAPDDGNADVSSINDLVVIRTSQDCSGSSTLNTNGSVLIQPIEKGAYDLHSSYVAIPVSSFSTFYLQGDHSLALPLRLLSFTARKNDNMVALDWKTGDEINTSYFELQRSHNGVNFSGLAIINAFNSPGIHPYSFNDMHPYAGTNYYRLNQIDRDGRSVFSRILRVTFDDNEKVRTWPNPVTDELIIEYQGPAGIVRASIFDSRGALVKNLTMSSSTNMYIDVRSLSKGMYWIEISNGIHTSRTRFIRQ